MSEGTPHRISNRGGGYVEGFEIVPLQGEHLLQLRGPIGAVSQICLTDPRYVPLSAVNAWTHRLRGIGRTPTQAAESLLDLLSRVVTLRTSNLLDFGIALDWYKAPVDGIDPRNWPNTALADLVSRGKYWYLKDPQSTAKLRESGRALTAKLCGVIDQHPVLRSVDAIVAVPGHDAKVVSFGARLAAAVARGLAKPLVRCTALQKFRTPLKSLSPAERAALIADQFTCREDSLTDRSLLIVDDVYSSGSTASETARALRQAGASNVACLCAVRTLRS